jgi:serine/threonine protein kinase
MRERDIFIEALQKANPAERSACLDAACADDDALRQRVLQLLAQHEKNESFLLDALPQTSDAPTGTLGQLNHETAGTVVGPFKLLEPIGEGGMGTVWMAQQTEPVKRLVALKLIKAGMDSKQVIARFEAERQALALMDHANIARVLDAGTTGVGRPYFVMDLVKGVPITRYCDEHHLTPRQRLELFLPVCAAVQHAHQKGIIHRDLKPSNVLVALYDGKPVPKVIDFGVAKAVGQSLTDKTLITGFGNIVGTLEYMSPEQAEVNQLDIDTRSDIYSLGVLLYELLTGSPPFTKKDLEKAGMLEMLRVIREVEPSRPSTKLSTADGLPTLAANRGTEPARLTKLVRGELDWIVMKALEKDRNRRYETANGFAMDVQRYLADESVQACPPSKAYRLKKVIRRNRAAVLAGAFVLAALLAGTALATWQAVRATRAERAARTAESQAEENFRQARAAVDEYFTRVSESKLLDVPGLQPLRKDLLESARKYYESFLEKRGDDPNVRAEAAASWYRLAILTQLIGSKDAAVAIFLKALNLYEVLVRAHPDEHRFQSDLAICYNDLGILYRSVGRAAEAMNTQQKALAIREPLARAHPRGARYQHELAKSYANLGYLHQDSGRAADAFTAHRQAHEINAWLATDPQPDLDFPSDLGKRQNSPWAFRLDLTQNLLGMSYAQFSAGRFDEALRLREQARDGAEALARERPTDPDVQEVRASCYSDMSFVLSTLGRHADALRALHNARTILERLVADNPAVGKHQKDLANTHKSIGSILSTQGRNVEALESYAAARRILEPLIAAHPGITWNRSILAWVESQQAYALFQTGAPFDEVIRHLEAARALAESLVATEKTSIDFRSQLASAHTQLGWHLARAGRKDAAWDARQAARAIQETLVADSPAVGLKYELSETYNELGRLAVDLDRPAEADDYIRRALDIRERLAREHPAVDRYQSGMAYVFRSVEMAQSKAGHKSEARAAIRKARAIDERLASKYPLNAFNLACDIAMELKLMSGDPAEPDAEAVKRRLADQAMAALRQAFNTGYGRVSQFEDPDFAPLQSRDDFKALLAEVRAREKARRSDPVGEKTQPPQPPKP